MSTQIDIQALALAYRRLVLWFGVQLVASAAQGLLKVQQSLGAVGRVNTAEPSWASVILTLAIAATIWTTLLALAIYGYRTARALKLSVAWLWAIVMVIPLVNAIVLLILSHKATKGCRQHGIPVGLFGPEIPA